MATSKWVYDKATQKFLYGGFWEPIFDPATQGLVEFGDADPHPDPVRQRFDAEVESGRRDATPEEIAEVENDRRVAEAAAVFEQPAIKALVEVFAARLGAPIVSGGGEVMTLPDNGSVIDGGVIDNSGVLLEGLRQEFIAKYKQS